LGRLKHFAMEEEDRGFYSVGNKYVCSACVGDKDLGRFIKDNGNRSQCTYCESKHSIVLHFDELMSFILDCLSQEYGDPNNVGVAWDKGWVGDVFDTYDFLDKVGIPIENMEFQEDILYSLSDRQWCKQDFYNLSPELVLSYGWREFVDAVKHKSRYVFYRVPDSREYRGYEELSPGYFLDALCSVIESLSLYKKIEVGTGLIRIRIHRKDEKFTKAEELGPPPLEYATYPNRMSPSGIPMFYGAYNLKTAIAETYTPDGQSKVGTVGKFETVKELTLVDLSKLPPPKGIFSGASRDYRHGLSFLKEFLEDFTAPVSKDGREHIDYVPTQVVSEHLRFIHKTGEGSSIDGIIYPSSKDRGKKAVVLFCENKNCSDDATMHENTLLKLTKVSRVNPERYV
jgi:hypothetical protein